MAAPVSGVPAERGRPNECIVYVYIVYTLSFDSELMIENHAMIFRLCVEEYFVSDLSHLLATRIIDARNMMYFVAIQDHEA